MKDISYSGEMDLLYFPFILVGFAFFGSFAFLTNALNLTKNYTVVFNTTVCNFFVCYIDMPCLPLAIYGIMKQWCYIVCVVLICPVASSCGNPHGDPYPPYHRTHL